MPRLPAVPTLAAAALLRQASQQAPEDPWLRLDLARALRRQGNAPEGRALVEELAACTGRHNNAHVSLNGCTPRISPAVAMDSRPSPAVRRAEK